MSLYRAGGTVLSLKPGHDGAAAGLVDGHLAFSFEGEKDSSRRNGPLVPATITEALRTLPSPPDVVATSGWYTLLPGRLGKLGGGYRGLQPGELQKELMLGRETWTYTSSHERSHVFCGVGLSPFDPESELAILTWEGQIGSFYRWTGPRAPITSLEVLDQPGARYTALFCLADETFPSSGGWPAGNQAGKLMALVGCADDRPPSNDSVAVVESLLKVRALYPFDKARYRTSPLFNCGVTNPELCRAARLLSNRIYEIFYAAAEAQFSHKRVPLVIVGGCGLNCGWNSAWRASGLFSDVFVPPCANDSGSAIGTAIDAQVQLGGPCSLEWNVFSGASFVRDENPEASGWTSHLADPLLLSKRLSSGAIVAWVQGRCEIGPRALGNRSLLADATLRESATKLNAIKQRESYRPIAPICLEEEVGRWFDDDFPDRYMLYFRRVKAPAITPAITHVDGTARVQTVTKLSNPSAHRLLEAHGLRTGCGVLCNTSLNFPGRGFINRMSDLMLYCEGTGIRDFVVDETWYSRDVTAKFDEV